MENSSGLSCKTKNTGLPNLNDLFGAPVQAWQLSNAMDFLENLLIDPYKAVIIFVETKVQSFHWKLLIKPYFFEALFMDRRNPFDGSSTM